MVTEKLTEALDLLKVPSAVIAKSEVSVLAARTYDEDQEYGLRTNKCPHCQHKLKETGLEGSDSGPDVHWLYCERCGYEVLP